MSRLVQRFRARLARRFRARRAEAGLAILVFALSGTAAFAEEASFSFKARGRYKYTERADFSRYVGGAYMGHAYRETRAIIEGESVKEGVRFRGGFLVFEETLRDMTLASRLVDEEVPADFTVAADGSLTINADEGFPTLRGFPTFPKGSVAVGARWEAGGVRAVDPDNTGKYTRIPFLAEYSYRGLSTYGDRPVYSIQAKYATRYGNERDRKGDPELRSGVGSHAADIFVDVETGYPLLIRDRFDETFTYASGKTIRQKGFLLVFSDAVNSIDYDESIGGLRRALSEPPPGPSLASATPSTGATPTGPGLPGMPAGPAPSPTTAEGPAPSLSSGPSLSSAPSLSSVGPGYLLPGGELELDLGSGVTASKTEEGILLTVKDLRFVADGDAVLPEEMWRLDAIAEALRGIPGRSFLVSGHTADVGRPADEMALSIRRAKRVVDELAARGIAANRFLYRGYGATKPLAPNDTEEGKAKNRRVEILVLED